ncbi:MAG: ribosome-associated translation inhibitor RaiA [candidate division WOR-3 bacterium]
MIFNITTRHFELTDEIREFTEKKFRKLNVFDNLIVKVDIVLSNEGSLKIAEGKVSLRGSFLIAKTQSHDIFLAITQLADKLLKQLKSFDGKLKSKKRINRVS